MPGGRARTEQNDPDIAGIDNMVPCDTGVFARYRNTVRVLANSVYGIVSAGVTGNKVIADDSAWRIASDALGRSVAFGRSVNAHIACPRDGIQARRNDRRARSVAHMHICGQAVMFQPDAIDDSVALTGHPDVLHRRAFVGYDQCLVSTRRGACAEVRDADDTCHARILLAAGDAGRGQCHALGDRNFSVSEYDSMGSKRNDL